MKKTLAVALALCMLISNFAVYGAVDPSIPVPELRGEAVDLTNMTSIDAYDKGVELLYNSVFTDTSNNSYKREITRIAAQGIINRRDGEQFSPTLYVSRGDTLKYMVRLLGNEGAVNQTVLTNSQGMDSNSIRSLYQDEYANSAVNSGVLTQEEIGNLSEPATKEDIAVWLSRALGLQPDYNNQDILFTYKDWENVVPENRAIIEELLKSDIMEVDNDGNFKADRFVTRGEMAYILDKASPSTFAQRAMTSNTGIVIGYNSNTVVENGQSVVNTPIIVKNLDGSMTTINVKFNQETNKKNEFVSYENGVASDSRIINIGDEIQYISMNNQVFFVEVFGDNTVLEKMRQMRNDDTNTKTYFGTVNKIINERTYMGKGYTETTRVRLNNYDGSVFDVVVDYDAVNNIKNDINVFKGNIYGGVDLLTEGDAVEYKVRDNSTLEYLNVSDINEETVRGNIRNIKIPEDGGLDSITVYDYDNNIREYYVPDYASIDINSKYGQLKDLQFGQEVELEVKDGMVLVIKSETFVENPGYIPEYGKQRIGSVEKVYEDRITVSLEDGSIDTFFLNNYTVIQKDNLTYEPKVLRDGDKVKLYFNDIYTDTASKVVIEGKEQLITNVYTGIIDDVDPFGKKIFLREPYELDNTKWNEVDDYRKELIFDNESEIYFMEDMVNLDRLDKEFKNEVVYVAVKDSYGKEKVAKMNIQSGGERTFEDEIQNVNGVLKEFELENKSNINYGNGTIVVKQDRLVEPSNIVKKRTAFIIAGHNSGNNNANIVRMFGESNEVFKNIHIGTIEELDIRSVEMANHSKMRYNEYDEVNDDYLKKFYYYNDTLIKDITDPRKELEISPYKFFHGGYTREENKDEDDKGLNYERYYAVFYTNDSDGIEAMNIRKEGLLRNYNIDDEVGSSKDLVKELNNILKKSVVTKGKIVERDDKWKRVKITDTQDWVKSTGEWSSNRNDMYVDVADAVIIRNGRPYEYDNLREGQRVYISRYKEDAIAIVLE
jgi:hypothetical protein